MKPLKSRVADFLKRNDGLGYLQVFNILKTAAIAVSAVIFAWLVGDHSLIGQWETLLMLGSAFTFFYVSGLGYTLVSFVKKYPDTERELIYRSSFQLLLVFGILSSLGIWILGSVNGSFSMPWSDTLLFSVFLTGTVSSTIGEYILFIQRSFRKMMAWGILNMVLFAFLPAIPLIYGYPFIYTIALLACLGILRFFFTVSLVSRPFYFVLTPYFKRLMEFNWPVILSLLLGSGYVYYAGILLKSTVSDEAFNLFRYGSRDFPYFLVIANAFSVVLGGASSHEFGEPTFWNSLRKNHLRLLHQLFPAACAMMLISGHIFTVFFSPSFTEAAQIFNILMLTLAGRVLFPQSLLMAKGKNKYYLFASMLEFAAGLLLIWILTPIFGISGAAWAIVLAFLIEKAALTIFCYTERIPFHKSLHRGWYSLYVLLIIISYILASAHF